MVQVTPEEKTEALEKIRKSMIDNPDQPVVLKRNGKTLQIILRLLMESAGE